MIEPETLCPIIPMSLVNGANGIGTGYSTRIWMYNPLDIIAWIIGKLNDDETKEPAPWYKGYTAPIVRVGNTSTYTTTCPIERVGDKIIVREMPPERWYNDFDEDIDEMIQMGEATDKNVDMLVNGNNVYTISGMQGSDEEIAKKLGLSMRFTGTNMVMHKADTYTPKLYNNVTEIMNDHYEVRLEMYTKRKLHRIAHLEGVIEKMSHKRKILQMIVDESIVVFKRRKEDIYTDMESNGIPRETIKGLNLMSVSEEALKEMDDQIEEQENEMKLTKECSEETKWELELVELRDFLKSNWENVELTESTPKKKTKKKTTKKKVTTDKEEKNVKTKKKKAAASKDAKKAEETTEE